MRFSIASAVVAFAASALAQTADFNPVNVPEKGEVIQAGSNFEVQWDAPAKYSDGTITISLIGGADQNSLVPISDIDSGIPNSDESYSWSVDPSLGSDAMYGLVMKLDSNPDIFQYSKPFKIAAGKDDGKDDGKGDGKNGKPTKTLTTATGVQTVTLSSCPPTTTMVTSTRHHNTTTSSHEQTSSQSKPSSVYLPPPPPHSSSPAPPPPPPQEPTQPAPTPEPTPEPTQPETPAPTAAGAQLVAGPVALVGGLAIAFLAL